MLRVVENCIGADDQGARKFDFFSCIEIVIESRNARVIFVESLAG
jgi:hypothetical protein